MKKHILGNLTFFDIPKIVFLSFIQASAMTLLLNYIIMEDFVFPITGLLAFIQFQLLLILPLDKDLHSSDFQSLLSQVWPIILEIVLELILLVVCAFILYPLTKFGYSTSYFLDVHYICLIIHMVFLVPLYTFTFYKKEAKYYQYIKKTKVISDLRKNKHYLLAIFLNFSYTLSFVVGYTYLGWGSPYLFFGFLIVPFILNLFIQKWVDPFSQFVPSNIAKLFLNHIAWHWIAVVSLWIPITDHLKVYQVFGYINLYGLLLIQYFYQQSLSKSIRNSRLNRIAFEEQRDLSPNNEFKTQFNEKYCCPTCGNKVSATVLTELSENAPIFCVQCGEKIRFQEIFPLPKEKILSDHERILKKVQQSPSSLHSSEKKY